MYLRARSAGCDEAALQEAHDERARAGEGVEDMHAGVGQPQAPNSCCKASLALWMMKSTTSTGV